MVARLAGALAAAVLRGRVGQRRFGGADLEDHAAHAVAPLALALEPDVAVRRHQPDRAALEAAHVEGPAVGAAVLGRIRRLAVAFLLAGAERPEVAHAHAAAAGQ